ncbi:MAG TPA: hypothetical protein VK035_08885, partial [Kiloniellales bacterium]|nr:hypothetical protein [Kiloniellales bacterium]
TRQTCNRHDLTAAAGKKGEQPATKSGVSVYIRAPRPSARTFDPESWRSALLATAEGMVDNRSLGT